MLPSCKYTWRSPVHALMELDETSSLPMGRGPDPLPPLLGDVAVLDIPYSAKSVLLGTPFACVPALEHRRGHCTSVASWHVTQSRPSFGGWGHASCSRGTAGRWTICCTSCFPSWLLSRLAHVPLTGAYIPAPRPLLRCWGIGRLQISTIHF